MIEVIIGIEITFWEDCEKLQKPTFIVMPYLKTVNFNIHYNW